LGTTIRTALTRLVEDLEKNAPLYHVWQAVFLSEKVSAKLHPNRKDFLLDQAGIKFRPFEQYIFPPRDIRSFSFDNHQMTFVLNFMGLYGINSPLPRCYHEQVALQQNIRGAGEVPLQNFLDIFNNRFYWLYYQAWKKYRFYLQLDGNFQNKIAKRVSAFMGGGPSGHEIGNIISKYTLLKFSGIFCQRVRNKAGLLILLCHLFPKFRFRILEFIPKRIKLSNNPLLGNSDEEYQFKLGQNSFIGDTTIDYMSKICIKIGPVMFEDYLDFTPGSLQTERLREILNLYVNDNLEYDINIIIISESIVPVAWNDERLKLGSTIWLGRPKQKYFEAYYSYEELTSVN